MSDEAHAHELAERLREVRLPACPQMRPACVERLYPVQGYCVLSQAPAWFMIPSIEEFRHYCTTPRFRQCPWFVGAGDGTDQGPPEVRASPPINVWSPPGMPQSRAEA